jgi:hypothetical protein
MVVVGVILTALSSLVVIFNICGCIGACRNQKRGIDRGYSNVPLISLLFGILGWIFAP